MDDLIEFILEILLEGSVHVLEEKQRKPLWLRVICIILIVLFACLFLFIAVGLFGLSISLWKDHETAMSIVMVCLDLAVWIYCIHFIREIYHSIQKMKMEEENEL